MSMLMDMKQEKVSNYWILIGIVTSFYLRIFFLGNTTLWNWLEGMFVPFIVLFPLFVGKMLGTGDIKVFMVLGSIMGKIRILQCMLVAFVIGGIISIPVLLIRCDIYERFSYFISYVVSVMQTRTIQPYLAPGERPENIHFTIPIFCSVVLLIVQGGYL